jgi:hypothetical protein
VFEKNCPIARRNIESANFPASDDATECMKELMDWNIHPPRHRHSEKDDCYIQEKGSRNTKLESR